MPPERCHWAVHLLLEFAQFPRLAAVGMNFAEYWYPFAALPDLPHEGETQPGGRDRRGAYGVLHQDPAHGLPFEFVSVADYAPYAVRREAYLEVGGMDEGVVEPGECGIMTDYELSLRFWMAGWQARRAAGRAAARGGCGGPPPPRAWRERAPRRPPAGWVHPPSRRVRARGAGFQPLQPGDERAVLGPADAPHLRAAERAVQADGRRARLG